MPAKRKATNKIVATTTPRASVTFPPALYRTLEEIAKRKKVSLAWVVRDAAEKYVSEQSSEPKGR